MNRQRATKQEIFSKLETLLGPSAPRSVATIIDHYQAENTEAALEIIAQLEEQIGGQYGIMAYVRQIQKRYRVEDRGIYRPFYYIRIRLTHPQPQHFTRDIVRDACLHIEGILKRAIRLTFRERIAESAGNLPMGSLLRHRKHKKELVTELSPDLYDNILWLNDNIYIFDKHAFSNLPAKTIAEEEEARLFQLDEAVAIYLIARYLGFSLLSQLGLLEIIDAGI